MIIYQRVLEAFKKAKVKYCIVGGIAVNLLGAMRSTSDLDLLVEMSDENLAKVVAILKKLGYGVRQPVDPMGIADAETRQYWIRNKNVKAFNFYKDKTLEQVDVIIESPVSYERAAKSLKRLRVGGLILPVISLKNLILMKRAAGRPWDEADILSLKTAQRARKA